MIPLYVLIGGKSSRFGQDKASYLIDGLPWAVHVAQCLAPHEDLTLVGSPPDGPMAKPLAGLRYLPDAQPQGESQGGPLAGIMAAVEDRLARHGEGMLALASCDLVRPQATWLAPLIAAFETDTALEVAAYQSGNVWQPFPSIAHTRWAARLSESLVSQDRSCQAAFNTARSHPKPWPGPGDSPPQANTVEELRRLLGDS